MLSRKFKPTVSGRTGPHGDRTTTRELHGAARGPNRGRTGASRNYTGICLIALQVEAFFDGQACVYLDSKVKR